MRIAGIDPGLSGALAVWDTEFGLMDVKDLPVISTRSKARGGKGKSQTRINANDLTDMLRRSAVDHVCVEDVHAMPKQGVVSTFKFGMTFGVILGVIAGLGIPLSLVEPQRWKPRFRLLRQDKQASRMVASQLLPANTTDFRRVMDADRAEACLIALYAAELITPNELAA